MSPLLWEEIGSFSDEKLLDALVQQLGPYQERDHQVVREVLHRIFVMLRTLQKHE